MNPDFNQSVRSRVLATIRTLAFVLVMILPFCGRAVTLAEFGQGSMRQNNKLPVGTHPLLVIVANYGGTPDAVTNVDWGSFVFAFGSTYINGYYWEISNERFSWKSAGLLTVSFTQPERMTINTRPVIVQAVQSKTGFDFANFDVNQDGTVTSDELCILIIHNISDLAGQESDMRLTVPSPSRTNITLSLAACDVAQRQGLMTMCHEMCHTLGALDIYGIWSLDGLHNQITLMGPTPADMDRQRWHLDPWHKMVLGWSEPRIVSLRGDNDAIIPAAQFKRPDAPVLLYDPLRGTSEFYLLECRTNNSRIGAGYDTDVASSGLL